MSRRRPVLLDLYCGRGGAAMGYYRAGFDVVGVDIEPQPDYPFDFVQADAIEYTLQHGHEYDARHASPTCTGYSRGTAAVPDRLARYDRLIGATREALLTVGGPYVIENVADARSELRNPVMLCWSMFRDAGSVLDVDGTPLRMERHRLFETNVPLGLLPGCYHPSRIQVAGAYGGARRDRFEARHVRKGGYVPPTLDVLRELLGTPWMDEKGCFLSVPPDYTEWIGGHVLDALDASAWAVAA